MGGAPVPAPADDFAGFDSAPAPPPPGSAPPTSAAQSGAGLGALGLLPANY